MLTAVKGVYKNGRVELSETPPETEDEEPVIVTFLSTRPKARDVGQMITYGKYKGPIDTTEEDFKIAEFHPRLDELDAE